MDRTRSCSGRIRVVGGAGATDTPGANEAVPVTLVPGPTQAYAAQMVSKGIPPPRWFVLAPDTKSRLSVLFSRFSGVAFDLGRLSITTGGAFGQGGITFGNTICLSREFAARDPLVQLGLLAHEITHSVQYKMLGWVPFLSRYVREWRESRGDPYMTPGDSKTDALMRLPIHSVNPVDPNFYLDQLGDRFRAAAMLHR
jgi:hypothetical protein